MKKESIFITFLIFSLLSLAFFVKAYTIQNLANSISQIFSPSQNSGTTGGFSFFQWVQSLFQPLVSCTCSSHICSSGCMDSGSSCQNPSDCQAAGCTPSCTGQPCGADDGCGSRCQPGSGCTACTPSCTNKPCGASDGCGSICQAGSGCSSTCTPSCTGKQCGADDGCGNPCQAGSGCTPTGCTPSCTGKQCGADDGCGNPCQAGSGCTPSCSGSLIQGQTCPNNCAQGCWCAASGSTIQAGDTCTFQNACPDLTSGGVCPANCKGVCSCPNTIGYVNPGDKCTAASTTCPYDCCSNDPNYKDKPCTSGQCTSSHTCTTGTPECDSQCGSPAPSQTGCLGMNGVTCALSNYYCGKTNQCYTSQTSCKTACGGTTDCVGKICSSPTNCCNGYTCSNKQCVKLNPSCGGAGGRCLISESGCQSVCGSSNNYQFSSNYDCDAGWGCCICSSAANCHSDPECANYNSIDGCVVGKCSGSATVYGTCSAKTLPDGTSCNNNQGTCKNGKCQCDAASCTKKCAPQVGTCNAETNNCDCSSATSCTADSCTKQCAAKTPTQVGTCVSNECQCTTCTADSCTKQCQVSGQVGTCGSDGCSCTSPIGCDANCKKLSITYIGTCKPFTCWTKDTIYIGSGPRAGCYALTDACCCTQNQGSSPTQSCNDACTHWSSDYTGGSCSPASSSSPTGNCDPLKGQTPYPGALTNCGLIDVCCCQASTQPSPSGENTCESAGLHSANDCDGKCASTEDCVSATTPTGLNCNQCRTKSSSSGITCDASCKTILSYLSGTCKPFGSCDFANGEIAGGIGSPYCSALTDWCCCKGGPVQPSQSCSDACTGFSSDYESGTCTSLKSCDESQGYLPLPVPGSKVCPGVLDMCCCKPVANSNPQPSSTCTDICKRVSSLFVSGECSPIDPGCPTNTVPASFGKGAGCSGTTDVCCCKSGGLGSYSLTSNNEITRSCVAGSQCTAYLQSPASEALWVLTGTPIKNRITVGSDPNSILFTPEAPGTVKIIVFKFNPSFSVFTITMNVQSS